MQITLTLDSKGQVSTKSQLQDYVCRGVELENRNLLSFLVDTYETEIDNSLQSKSSAATEQEPNPIKQGRKPNLRSRYTQEHPRHQNRQRIVRSAGHNHLPYFVGPHFPRADDEDQHELYCCSVLVLLKPWRKLQDLKLNYRSWKDALQAYLDTNPPYVRRIMANLQFYYHSADSAEQESSGNDIAEGVSRPNELQRIAPHEQEDADIELGEDFASASLQLTEEMVKQVERNDSREDTYSRGALDIARSSNIVSEDGLNGWAVNATRGAGRATGNGYGQVGRLERGSQISSLGTKQSRGWK